METDLGELYKANHRRQQLMLAAAAGIVLFCGLAPRNERALFFTELPRTVRALSVAVPPVGYTVIGDEGPVGAFRKFLARPRGGRSAAVPDLFPVPAATPFAMANDGLTIPFAGIPGFLPATFGPNDGPPIFAGEPPGGTPVGPIDSGSTGGGSPPPTPNPPPPPTNPNPPGTPNTPVGAIPEPFTWVMLIFGFFTIGSALRRAPRLVQA